MFQMKSILHIPTVFCAAPPASLAAGAGAAARVTLGAAGGRAPGWSELLIADRRPISPMSTKYVPAVGARTALRRAVALAPAKEKVAIQATLDALR